MMNKIMALLLGVMMVLCFAACKDADKSDDSSAATTNTVSDDNDKDEAEDKTPSINGDASDGIELEEDEFDVDNSQDDNIVNDDTQTPPSEDTNIDDTSKNETPNDDVIETPSQDTDSDDNPEDETPDDSTSVIVSPDGTITLPKDEF